MTDPSNFWFGLVAFPIIVSIFAWIGALVYEGARRYEVNETMEEADHKRKQASFLVAVLAGGIAVLAFLTLWGNR